jgi:hypothetical protein
MDHHLENLGPERFQQLCQSLLVKEFPGTNCLPVGQPDGGRDAIQYAFLDGNSSSFAVCQVKYSRNPASGEDARKWVLEAVDGEVEKVRRLIERGGNKYLFATNVSGTAHIDVGSIDKLQGELEDKLGIPVLCWWRDDINRRLDGSWDIKLRYPEVMSGQDFLRLLFETAAGQEWKRRLAALKAFLIDQYTEDVDVKFKQVELHNKLLDLFVDLPFQLSIPARSSNQARVRNLAASAPFRMRLASSEEQRVVLVADQHDELEAGTATLLLNKFGTELKQVVVEGAPGQGKSTLAQYVCQVHRIRLLDKRTDLDRLPPHHRHVPVKVPFKLDLRDFATWLSGNDPFLSISETLIDHEHRSLETFLVHLVRHHCGGIQFDVNDLLNLSGIAPLLIVLDGLDEVVDIKQRANVVSEITKSIPRLQENCTELQIVITSRPAAFANSPGFDSEAFPHLHLGSVRRPQIDVYAKRWMEVRSLSRKERAEFEGILKEKLDQPHLRDLARNPMQLAILLSLIHRLGAALPDKRTSLYDAYVDLFFSRESAKSAVVRQHLDLLKEIHCYLGWELHSTAETGRRRLGGRISSEDIRSTLQDYLKREKHSTVVVDEVFGAMLERVVMIVSRLQGTYEFEVQPLREYFAARHLYNTSSYSPPGKEKTGTKPDRFDAIARNFYWLNVVRFFCGCFSKGELLDLADRVRELIDDDILGRSRHPVMLAAMLLSDWVFAQSPKAVAQVVAALSTPDSLRRLLGGSPTHRAEQELQIPPSCGGSDILAKAFDLLQHPRTRKDLGRRLAQFISMNGAAEDIDRRWLSSDEEMRTDVERWLWIGRELGALGRVNKVAITTVLGEGVLGDEIVDLLCDAGRYDCVLTSDANASLLRSRLLTSPVGWHAATTGKEPLYLLPMLLSQPTGFRFSPVIYRNDRNIDAIDRFKEARSTLDRDLEFACDLSQQAFELSCKFADFASVESPKRTASSEWEGFVEECRKRLGDWPAILFAANQITHMPRGRGSRLKPADLADRDRAICDRIRTAKSHAKSVNWWNEQLVRASDMADRFLFHLTFWTWAPPEVMFEMADDMASKLNALPPEEWSTLVRFLPLAMEGSYFQLVAGARENEHLPRKLRSRRLAFLVGTKAPAYGRAVFLNYFRADSRELDANIGAFRQFWALEAALAGVLPWHSAVSTIKSTYRQGASHYLIGFLFRERAKLPESVVDMILARAKDYPVPLWELAEGAASARARKAIRPVGKVAREERWFA